MPPHPEYRTLQQIVAEALAQGIPVCVLGPAGILEIQPGRVRSIDPAGPGWMDDVDVGPGGTGEDL